LKTKGRATKRTAEIIAITLVAVLAVATSLFVYRSTTEMSERFDETAYGNMTTYAEQCAAGINEIKTAYSGLCATLEANASWQENREHIVGNMHSIMSQYEVYYLAFISADGTGFDYRNEDITRMDLPFDSTQVGDYQAPYESAAYIGNTGRYEYCRQVPVMDNGRLVGDYYIGLSVNAQFNYLKNTNYRVFVVEKDSGRIIGSEGSTAMLGYSTSNLYRLIDNYASDDKRPSDADAHDATANKVMEEGSTAILPIYHTDTDQIACLTPVGNSNWYVCVTAEKGNINGGKDSIVGIVYQLLAACMGLLVAIGAVYLVFQRRASRAQSENMAVQESLNAQLQAALEDAKAASRAKSDFLTNMSHDIRTPMNAIVGMTNLAMQDIEDAPRATQDLEVVRSSSRHLLSLINDVLDLSKIESGKMVIGHEPYELPTAIDDVIEIMHPLFGAKSQIFTLHVLRLDHEFVVGDQTRMKQILVNILNNANKYTPAGGKIDLSVEELDATDAKTSTYRFKIADTGIGIAEDKLEGIWAPFTRETSSTVNEVEGTGLGLSIVKTIVEMRGGTVSVESEKGHGSTFTVTIPIDLQDEAQAMSRFDDLKDKRILLVENAEGSCSAVEGMLGDVVSEVDRTSDLDVAIGLLRSGMAGYHAAVVEERDGTCPMVSEIRRNAPDLPIVLLDSGDMPALEEDAIGAGACSVLRRPVFRCTLLDRLMNAGDDTTRGEDEGAYLAGKRVLVVEDQPINRMIAKIMVEQAGAVCEESENGKIAVAAFEASPVGYYDLILMDVMMPVMGGYEATRLIRGMDRGDAKTVPIVAMTANAFAEDIERSREAGMDAHVSKPVEPPTLKRTLRSVLKL
jgi:signal transduction histidine kinase/CheY-like chemotaxis protein